jgi:serpin B
MNMHRLRIVMIGIIVLAILAGSSLAGLSEAYEMRQQDVAAGNNAFAFDLYWAVRDGGDNLIFSPYSVSLALAMTYAGARGDTESQMAETLHFALPQDELHPAFKALTRACAQHSEDSEKTKASG